MRGGRCWYREVPPPPFCSRTEGPSGRVGRAELGGAAARVHMIAVVAHNGRAHPALLTARPAPMVADGWVGSVWRRASEGGQARVVNAWYARPTGACRAAAVMKSPSGGSEDREEDVRQEDGCEGDELAIGCLCLVNRWGRLRATMLQRVTITETCKKILLIQESFEAPGGL